MFAYLAKFGQEKKNLLKIEKLMVITDLSHP